MIDIYTEKKESSNWILKNDLYFNLNTSNEEMTEQDKNLIFQADDAILTLDKHIETKYGLGPHSSTHTTFSGCFTIFSKVLHPEDKFRIVPSPYFVSMCLSSVRIASSA